MREKELRKVLTHICDGFIDNILVSLDENKEIEKFFPYTLACINFICELKSKNIMVEFFDTFECSIVDKIYREVGSYIGR